MSVWVTTYVLCFFYYSSKYFLYLYNFGVAVFQNQNNEFVKKYLYRVWFIYSVIGELLILLIKTVKKLLLNVLFAYYWGKLPIQCWVDQWSAKLHIYMFLYITFE